MFTISTYILKIWSQPRIPKWIDHNFAWLLAQTRLLTVRKIAQAKATALLVRCANKSIYRTQATRTKES